jgi:hypothetical protein
MALNQFDAATSRRLSIGLMATAGALLFAALDLVGVGIAVNDPLFTQNVSKSIIPLAASAGIGLVSLIATEVAEHKSTPRAGHPHSTSNYLQTAFALLVVFGFGHLLFGSFQLISAVTFP